MSQRCCPRQLIEAANKTKLLYICIKYMLCRRSVVGFHMLFCSSHATLAKAPDVSWYARQGFFAFLRVVSIVPQSFGLQHATSSPGTAPKAMSHAS